jgi:hypothetical protein
MHSKFKEVNSAITVLITCGAEGVYCYSKKQIEFTPALKMPVVSTAGAGDAFLAVSSRVFVAVFQFLKMSMINILAQLLFQVQLNWHIACFIVRDIPGYHSC